MKDFDRRVVPVAGLDEVIVEEPVMKQLREVVQFEKARWQFPNKKSSLISFLSQSTQSCALWSVGFCKAQSSGSDYPPSRPTWHWKDNGS